MHNGFPILPLLAFVLVCLAAGLYGRRLRARARHDLNLRLRRLQFSLWIYALLFVLETCLAFSRPGPDLFLKIFLPGCFAGCFAFNLYVFLRIRKVMRELPAMTSTKVARPVPAFLWQAVLILLPVTLMAGFGFWEVLRERHAVEHEAQQRAREILTSLPAEFGRTAANRLAQFDGPKGGWLNYLQNGVAAWPENNARRQMLGDANEMGYVAKNITALQTAFPEWHEGPVPLMNFWLQTNADLPFGHEIPPRPPAWLTTMSDRQRQTWAALETAARTTQSPEAVSNLFIAFKQTAPPSSPLSCAEFWQLRASLSSLSATNALDQLLQFIDRHSNEYSDSGVPLKTLVLLEALKQARTCGPTEQLWNDLLAEVAMPDMLTPNLLDEAAQTVTNDARLSESVKAMRILLADRQAQGELAAALKLAGKLNGIVTTNLWLNAMGRRWFCILSPSEIQLHTVRTTVSNREPDTIVTPITQVRCFPKSVVIRGFANAFADAGVSLPKYFSITLELESEPIPLPSPWSDLADDKPSGDILAEQGFQMSQLFVKFREEGKFEAMPGHPQFALQIRLTDRNLLYAHQHRLQFVFGALIAASALAALIGVIAAYRAFRREQQLNEMKSNFVSSVSHELRAPIASVRLMAENLERGKIPDPERQGEYFHFIVQECRRLSALIENVLDFSRIEQGRKQYEFEPTNLIALVETTVKLMEPYAAEKGVNLKLESSSSSAGNANLELDIDGRAMQQALVNLIDNAVKHSPKGETVIVEINAAAGSINHQPSTINLSVIDHGPGIPIAEREKIFERFYRLGSELRRETQGVGIGLSVVKHIVEAHGGRVMVESEIAKGSRFTIELPVKNKP